MDFSVIVPSVGRPTLAGTLASIASQMLAGDELMVKVNANGDWGNSARNHMMLKAHGQYLLFMDDDDYYLPGAFDIIRQALLLAPDRMHLFRMQYADGRPTLWTDRVIRDGNVSTQMVVVPNVSNLPAWPGHEYAADLSFISEASTMFGVPVWHEEVIAEVR